MSCRILPAGRLSSQSLAVFRIALGLLVTVDSLQALGDVFVLYSDEGMLPLATLHAAGVGSGTASLHFTCRWWPWNLLLLFLQLCGAVCLTLGFRSQRAALLSALLLYSLLGRNPYVVGLEDGWIVLLLLAAAFLPVGKVWGLDGRVWKAGHTRTVDWYVCLGTVLSVQGAMARELLLNSSGLSSLNLGPLGPFWAVSTVFGIYLLHQKNSLRRGGVVLLVSQSLWLFGPGRLFLVALIALSSLWPSWSGNAPEGARCEGRADFLGELAATLLILEVWSLVSLLGAPIPPIFTAVQGDRTLKTARRVFLIKPETGERIALADGLPRWNFRVARYLSSSCIWDNPSQWRDIATYYDRAQGVKESRSYTIAVQPDLTSGTAVSARILAEVKTRPGLPPLLERFPRMDRTDVNKPQTMDTKPGGKLSGNRS